MTKPRTELVFWDTSGVLLLALDQRGAAAARALRRTTRTLVVWWGAPIEASSALGRLVRDGALSASDLKLAERRLALLFDGSIEVAPSEAVRERARSLVLTHPLRAGDAQQLAAALAWTGDRPRGKGFVTFDDRLGAVARALGFDVRPGAK